MIKGDAAEWASRTLRGWRKRERSKAGPLSSRDENDFDILLVDPPRDGLSPTVCDMATRGAFEHVI